MLVNKNNFMNFSAGERIFSEGGTADGVYLIAEGTVEISKKQNGERLVLATMGVNEIFGEMALIDGKPRSAEARAVTPCRCIKVDNLNFKSRIASLDPFMQGMFRVLSEKVRLMNDRLAETEKK